MANTHYSSTPIIGAALDDTSSEAQFKIGTRISTESGGTAVYCVASGAITQYQLVGINEDFDAYAMTSTLAAQSDLVGFAQVAIASGEYGWIHLNGSDIKVRTKASAAADAQLWTTASAGVVDDATAAGAVKIDGVVLVAAAGTAANGAAGIEVKATWPALRES